MFDETIASNVQIAVNLFIKFENVQLQFNEQSIGHLDEFIQAKRGVFDKATIAKMIEVFGSFLGECVRKSYGGDWDEINSEPAIRFDEKNAVFPFNKVRKQFENGHEDSILSFYQCIPLVFKISS